MTRAVRGQMQLSDAVTAAASCAADDGTFVSQSGREDCEGRAAAFRPSIGALSASRVLLLPTTWVIFVPMDALITSALESLRTAGWTIELESQPRPLPPAITERYGAIPELFIEFATRVRRCERGDESVWILTASDYSKAPDPGGFAWNTFETMILEPGPGNGRVDRTRTRSFWRRHMPILQAVGGDYEYFAIDTESGAVVSADLLDFDNPGQTAQDVISFFRQLADVGVAEPTRSLICSNDLARFVHSDIIEDVSKPASGWTAPLRKWFRP